MTHSLAARTGAFGLCVLSVAWALPARAENRLSAFTHEIAYERYSSPSQQEALIDEAEREARPMMVALAFEARGLQDRAILIYRELIRQRRFVFQAHQGLARIYQQRKDYDRAIEHLEAASPVTEFWARSSPSESPRVSRRPNR